MPAQPPYDPRAVANLVLDQAAVREWPISNLALQKLLYFAHGRYLVRTSLGLVGGYFEAWEHGPVHPLVYDAFKKHGASAITDRAKGVDYVQRCEVDLPAPDDALATATVREVVDRLVGLTPSRLRAISHAPKGPWSETIRSFEARNKAGTKSVLGLRISDTLTAQRFRYLLVPLGSEESPGDHGEDTPFA